MSKLLDFNSIKSLKTAKKYKRDFLFILKVLDITALGLSRFTQYKVVEHLLINIVNSKKLIDKNIKVCDIIISKGAQTYDQVETNLQETSGHSENS